MVPGVGWNRGVSGGCRPGGKRGAREGSGLARQVMEREGWSGLLGASLWSGRSGGSSGVGVGRGEVKRVIRALLVWDCVADGGWSDRVSRLGLGTVSAHAICFFGS